MNRKTIAIACAILATAISARAQSDNIPSWFSRNVTIGQSMATAETQALPAQFAVTLPKDKASSWLVNLGTAIQLGSANPHWLSSATLEFHRNSLTDSVQNNFAAGYKAVVGLGAIGPSSFSLTFDPQWAHDQVKKTNSIQSNLLLTWKKRSGFHIGIPTFHGNNFSRLGLLGGTQLQQVFPNDTSSGFKGFKVRPLLTGSYGYFFSRNGDDSDPMLGLTLNYTQRIAAVNNSADLEKWSHQFTAAVNYYIISKPAKVSVGVTFLNGSDPYTGLKQQQYFLLSLNIFAKKPE
jgi:hypothetical protein